jgi:hypothetical protein
MKTLSEMNVEIRELNTEKGWRTGDNTFGDYEALLQSEIAELTENYRDHRLDRYTVPDGPKAGKPDDVGSEAADVFIRLLDMCDVFGVRLGILDHGMTLADLAVADLPDRLKTFGDHVNYLHKRAAKIELGDASAPYMVGMFLCDLLAFCAKFGLDLDDEYERKMAYNWKRPYQHGGRTLSDSGRVVS